MKKELLDNLEKIHTTKLGIERIKRNLNLGDTDVVSFCKNLVTNNNANVYKKGKNYYVEVNNIIITINSYSYTIITAKILK